VKIKKIKSSNSYSRLNRASKQPSRVLLAISFIALAVFALNLLPNPIRTVNATQDEKISDSALSQIRSLMEAKLARTPEQQKIDSNLLAAIQVSRGEAIARNAPDLQPDVELDGQGNVLVDITAKVTDGLLEQIRASGGEEILAFKQYDAIRARIPLLQLEFLASSRNIKFIKRAMKMQTQRATQDEIAARSAKSQSFASRAGRVREQLPQAMRTFEAQDPAQPIPNVGAVTTAGDVAHRAATARATFGVNGSGVKVGVLSDSYNRFGAASSNVLAGDLPGSGNPNGFTTPVTVLQDSFESDDTDEGRAMMQIVHDIVPGAQLYFATANFGPANFANNIIALRNNGCDIIIDDIFYPDEAPFQDGVIAQAVNAVTANGALYFSSAGNSGNLNDGTSSTWEGDFNDSGLDLTVGGNFAGRLHLFNASTILNTVLTNGQFQVASLSWSDALGQSANDYDLFILNSAGTNVLRFSINSQTGFQDPFEIVAPINAGERIAVVKFSGNTRALHLSAGSCVLAVATPGQTVGHSCAVNAFNVAAVSVTTAGGGAFTGGASNPVETFSSDGPRRVFYNANGTAITPGNFLFVTGGGSLRQKPDIAAADRVATTVSGFNPFPGTSAAAPHAGAIAALLKSFKPTLTAAQIRATLTSTALDIEAAGVDRDSGFGIVMALAALQAVNGNKGTDTIGLFRSSSTFFFLRNTNTTGVPNIQFPFGASTDLPVVGDWNGDGVATIGLYRPSTSTFFLRNSNSAGVPDIQFSYGDGPGGDVPIAGDWNGDGIWTIGVYRPSTATFFLRNSNTPGPGEIVVPYGAVGDKPVLGDWDGNGTTTIGVYRPGTVTFFLRNSNTPGVANIAIPYGATGDTPIVGDWDGNGTTTIGVYRPSTTVFFLRNSNTAGIGEIVFQFGASGDKPLAGDWDGL